MTLSRPKHSPQLGKFVAGTAILLAALLVIVFIDPFFTGWIYLKFFLICGVGFANLGILFLMKSGM